MSITNVRFPTADILAAELEGYLRDSCDRVERAGAIRRRLAIVDAIEFVCTPATAPSLFAEIPTETALDQNLRLLAAGGLIRKHPTDPAEGERLRRYLLPYHWKNGDRPVWTAQGGKWTTLTIYTAPRHSFGYVHALRTGPASAAKKLVTQRNRGGWLPNDLVCNDGRVWQIKNAHGITLADPRPIYLPDEADFFELCGIQQSPPEYREPGRWQFLEEPHR